MSKKITLTLTLGVINFKWAALHMIGHSLGLKHSPVKRSVMFSWYNASHPVLKLHSVDIEAINSAYPSLKSTGEDSKVTLSHSLYLIGKKSWLKFWLVTKIFADYD